jgi:hypothetical protein
MLKVITRSVAVVRAARAAVPPTGRARAIESAAVTAAARSVVRPGRFAHRRSHGRAADDAGSMPALTIHGKGPRARTVPHSPAFLFSPLCRLVEVAETQAR